jgi:hypothetical protein
MSNHDEQLVKQREYLFHLIYCLNWDDESQERFLHKNGAKSWISANSKVIEKGIAKMLSTAKMFMIDVGTASEFDVYEDES